MKGKVFHILDNDISDGYHTFTELYDHRCVLYITLVLTSKLVGEVFWVQDHYDGWDLLGCGTDRTGQISYHVPMKYRYLYDHLPQKQLGHGQYLYDGHTPQDVIDRLTKICLSAI